MIQLINYGVERERVEAVWNVLHCHFRPLIQHPIPQPHRHRRLVLHLIKAEPAHVFATNDAHE